MFHSIFQFRRANNSGRDNKSEPSSSAPGIRDTSKIFPECSSNSLGSKQVCAALYSARYKSLIEYSTIITDTNGSNSVYLIEAEQAGEPYENDRGQCAMFEVSTAKVTEGAMPIIKPEVEKSLIELCVPSAR